MGKIIVINGPNLNLLGNRDKKTYGDETLEQINQKLQDYADRHDCTMKFFQSNIEGEIINAIQATGIAAA